MSVMSAMHTIEFGRSRIAFRVNLCERDRLQITVHPDMSVEVQAPTGKSLEDILRRVQKRAPWIAKQLRYFEQFQPRPVPKRFVSGETFRYLGRQYRLKAVKGIREEVKLSRPHLIVEVPDPSDRAAIERVVRDWYQMKARTILEERVEALYQETKRHIPFRPGIRVRHMVRRWGSCTPNGCIVFNRSLVQAPRHCIDYVIIHELCHLRHRDHGPRFQKLLTRLCPNWVHAKARLESSQITVF